LIEALLITGPLVFRGRVDEVIFSGGVGEFIYDREAADYGDFGRYLAAEIQRRISDFPAPVVEGAEAIRATVIGASQYTVQVSSSTIFRSAVDLLPLWDHQVVAPRFSGHESTADELAARITDALASYDLHGDGTGHAIALAVSWPHELSYQGLCLLA